MQLNSRALDLNHQTRIAVSIIIEDDSGVLFFSLILITRMLVRLVQACSFLMEMKHSLEIWLRDLQTALSVTLTLFIIAIKSWAYGLGVKV